jgi:lysophospholipase L1-like esterase
MVRDHSGGTYNFAASDGIGNVTALVNADDLGTSARYEYSAYKVNYCRRSRKAMSRLYRNLDYCYSIAVRLIPLSLFFCAVSTYSAAPGWFDKPTALPEPSGTVIRAKTADEILARTESLAPGATLLIEPGHYTFPRPLVLRAKTNIVIRSAAGDPASVTLTGKGWELGDDHDDLLHVSDCNGVLIAGLTFTECRSYGVKVEAEHGPKNIHIYNCRFRNIGIRAIKGSAGKDPNVRAVRGSVRYCDFENTRLPPAHWLFNGDYISAIDMMALEDWTFSDNSFRNIRGRNGGGRAAIFVWVRSTNVVVERNIILNCDRGIAFGNPGQSTANEPGALLAYVSNGTIRNNFISGGADCGIELWHVQGISVWHNSIWRPEINWGRGIRVGTGTTSTEIANNLVHGGIQMEGGEASVHHNLAKRLTNYFADPATGDLALTANARDAIDSGATAPSTFSPPSLTLDIKRAPYKGAPDLGAWEFGSERALWIDRMRQVHSRFRGTPGSFAQFGDSITYSGAFWSPLAEAPINMDASTATAYHQVKRYLLPQSFSQKGAEFGNQGSTTIRWAHENVASWLEKMNPEVAVLMFGSNDVHQLEPDEFETTLRRVINDCLDHGTIVLLTTPPPQTALIEKCKTFAEIARKITAELEVPLIDYATEIERRRPTDWDGALPAFKSVPGDTYEVPTLISRDGVHPSNPRAFANNFSPEALQANGFTLRNYLTLLTYSTVLREVLWASPGGGQNIAD